MSAVEPLWSALWLAARLMVPIAGGLVVAVALGGLARRLVGDDPALHAAARWVGVGAALWLFGGGIAEAVVEFARWSGGGG